MLKRNIPLRCRLVERVLTIEIGINTLRLAAERHDNFWQPETDKCALVVNDPERFALDVLGALLTEREDGSTMVTKMLDTAIADAVEQGAEGIDYEALEAILAAERLASQPSATDLKESHHD